MELTNAAKAIADADYLLITAGAGFSADSGLPVYADIARVEKYASCGKTYADLADISLLVSEPEMFTEFWQSCVINYNEKVPHMGYAILNKWCENFRKSTQNKSISPFYVYTSNVDGYFRQLSELKTQLCEMHGCVQEYICSSSIGFVHEATALPTSLEPSLSPESSTVAPTISEGTQMEECAPRSTALWAGWNAQTTPEQRRKCQEREVASKDIIAMSTIKSRSSQSGGLSNQSEEKGEPVLCADCQLPLRPKVVMFGDTCPNVLSRVAQDTTRYQAWESSMEVNLQQKEAGKLVILELGCGTRVPSVRVEGEEVLRDVTGIIPSTPPVLIRVNRSAEEAAITQDILDISPGSISIQGNCLDTLRAIDEILSSFSKS